MKIALPDGTVQDFPDGTDPADAAAAIAKMFPDQDAGATPPSVAAASPQLSQGQAQLTGLPRYAKMAGEAVTDALGHVAGLPGDLMSGIDKVAPKGSLTRTVLSGLNPLFGAPLTTSAQNEDVLAKHGLTNTSDVIPGWGDYPEAERLGYAGVKGLTEGAALPLAGGPVINALTGGASAVLGQGTEDYTHLGPTAAGVAGALPGLVGGKVSDIVAAKDALTTLKQPLSNLGVPVEQLTTGHLSQIRDEAIAAAKQQLDAADAAHIAERSAMAARIHPSATDPETAGQVMQSDALQWMQQRAPAEHAAAWAPVDEAVPDDVIVPRDSYAGALQSITTSRGANAGQSSIMVGNRAQALHREFFGSPEEQAAMASPDPYDGRVPSFYLPQSWQDARRWRSDLGEKIDPGLKRELGPAQVDQLYAAHTDDMRSALDGLPPATPGGVTPADAFDQANATSRAIYDFQEGPLAKVLKTDERSLTNPAPGTMATSLLNAGKKDGRDLAALRARLPEGTDALAATAVNTGRWTAMSDGAKAALVPNPWMRNEIDAMEQNAIDRDQGLVQAQSQARADYAQRSRDLQAYTSATKDKSNTEKDVLAALIGGGVGAAAPAVKDLLTGGDHRTDSAYYGGIGEALGAFAPRLYRGTSGMLRNPLYPAAGAYIGSQADDWPTKPKQ